MQNDCDLSMTTSSFNDAPVKGQFLTTIGRN